MADETSTTSGPADGSNEPKKNPSVPAQNPVEEARIIEEVVVRPASSPKPAPTSAPPSLPEKKSIPAPIPPIEKKLDLAPIPASSIPPSPRPLTPPLAPQVSAATQPAPQTTPPVASPPPPLVSPIPVAPKPAQEVSRSSSSLSEDVVEKERQDIAHILAEAKIPERRAAAQAAPEPRGIVFDTTLGATAASLDEKKIEVPASPPQSTTFESPAISPLRTLKKDLQEIVQVKKISLVRAAALEQEKRRGATSDESAAPAKRKRGFGFFLAIILFILLGGAALLGVYVVMNTNMTGPQTTSGTILFAESTFALPLQSDSPLELKRIIAQARAGGGGTLGSITQIVPTVPQTTAEGVASERAATLDEFFRALGTRTPADLTRALSSEFFFGIHTVDENAPLLVIPVASYERAFAGMLSWEETMNADLAPAFTSVPMQVIGAGGLPQKRLFEDVVMRNYDVRALKDDAGEIQLYYSFPTRSLLVISESPYSFTEILSRLRAERKL